MRQLLGQGACLMAPLQGLVRIAKKPQSPGHIAETKHPGIKSAIEEGQRVMLLGVIKSTCLLQVHAGRDNLPQVEQGEPQHIVSLQGEEQRRAGAGPGPGAVPPAHALSRNSPRTR